MLQSQFDVAEPAVAEPRHLGIALGGFDMWCNTLGFSLFGTLKHGKPDYATLKPAAECRFDQLSLGEVMLRLDPGEGRVRTARHFTVWEGGGEYNTSRGLRKCFGLRTAVCTAFVDNEVGHLIEDFISSQNAADIEQPATQV